MTAGRPRKPTALHLIQGTARAHHLNAREPKPTRKRPECPDGLSPRAKRAWQHFAPMLYDLGVLTEADTAALISLCEAAADRDAARAALAKRPGLAYESRTSTGAVSYRPYPEVALVSDADRRVKGWLSVFGLTPADRARVSVAQKEEPDDLDAMFT